MRTNNNHCIAVVYRFQILSITPPFVLSHTLCATYLVVRVLKFFQMLNEEQRAFWDDRVIVSVSLIPVSICCCCYGKEAIQ